MKATKTNMIPKFLRLEVKMIKEVEDLQEELSKVEPINFTALIRRLIRVGLRVSKPIKEKK